MDTVQEILEHARRLPSRERLQLIQELMRTLEPDESLSESEWDSAWLPELQARFAAYERGESLASDWQSVIERLRQSLDTSSQSS